MVTYGDLSVNNKIFLITLVIENILQVRTSTLLVLEFEWNRLCFKNRSVVIRSDLQIVPELILLRLHFAYLHIHFYARASVSGCRLSARRDYGRRRRRGAHLLRVASLGPAVCARAFNSHSHSFFSRFTIRLYLRVKSKLVSVCACKNPFIYVSITGSITVICCKTIGVRASQRAHFACRHQWPSH